MRKSPKIFAFCHRQLLSRLFIISLLTTSFSCSNPTSQISQDKVAENSQTSQDKVAETSQTSQDKAVETSQTSQDKVAETSQKKSQKTDSDYLNRLLPEAKRIQKEYGVPLDLTLAVARQESGNGDYVIGKGNHFGLRCASDDCITLEKNGRQISYETCPDVSECFNIFAKSVQELTNDKPITLTRLYQNGYASSPNWVERVKTIREEVRQTLSEADIKY